MSQKSAIRVSVKAIIVHEAKILLIGYDLDDGYGFHYNLPGGGIELGEGMYEALHREVREEANAHIEVGKLLFVTEYVPVHHDNKYGLIPSLNLFFHCMLRPESDPRQPALPIDDQKGVYWLALSELHHAPLLPNIGERIQTIFANGLPETSPFIADWQ